MVIKKKKRSGKNKIIFLKAIVFLSFFLFLSYIGWLLFFSFDDCGDLECFNENLRVCDRARFIDGDDMIFRYSILGRFGQECRIHTELLQGEFNNQDSLKLEGQSMVCNLPFGMVEVPENNIDECHGILKENLQDIVIKKMYSYIIQNIDNLGLQSINSSFN
jgi:hypothetical protein